MPGISAADKRKIRSLAASGMTPKEVADKTGWLERSVKDVLAEEPAVNPRMKGAAEKIGMSLEEYTARLNSGQAWCVLGHWAPEKEVLSSRCWEHRGLCKDGQHSNRKMVAGWPR